MAAFLADGGTSPIANAGSNFTVILTVIVTVATLGAVVWGLRRSLGDQRRVEKADLEQERVRADLANQIERAREEREELEANVRRGAVEEGEAALRRPALDE